MFGGSAMATRKVPRWRAVLGSEASEAGVRADHRAEMTLMGYRSTSMLLELASGRRPTIDERVTAMRLVLDADRRRR
jgi:hypothetical protein